MFIHSWTSRYCKPWVILRSLITDQMKVRQNLVAKWSLQRIAIFLSLKQTPTEMYQHKMLSSQTTHTYSIVGVIRVGTWYVAIRLKFIYLIYISSVIFFYFSNSAYITFRLLNIYWGVPCFKESQLNARCSRQKSPLYILTWNGTPF